MENPPVKEDVGGQLPQKIFLPNESRDKRKVVNKIIRVDFG
jgi:hypothetical protein